MSISSKSRLLNDVDDDDDSVDYEENENKNNNNDSKSDRESDCEDEYTSDDDDDDDYSDYDVNVNANATERQHHHFLPEYYSGLEHVHLEPNNETENQLNMARSSNVSLKHLVAEVEDLFDEPENEGVEVDLSWSGTSNLTSVGALVEPCRRARESFLWHVCIGACISFAVVLALYVFMTLWYVNEFCMRDEHLFGCSSWNQGEVEPRCPPLSKKIENRLTNVAFTGKVLKVQCTEKYGFVLVDLTGRRFLEKWEDSGQTLIRAQEVPITCSNGTWKLATDEYPADIKVETLSCMCDIRNQKRHGHEHLVYNGYVASNVTIKILRQNRIRVSCEDSKAKIKYITFKINEPFIVMECRHLYNYFWEWPEVSCHKK